MRLCRVWFGQSTHGPGGRATSHTPACKARGRSGPGPQPAVSSLQPGFVHSARGVRKAMADERPCHTARFCARRARRPKGHGRRAAMPHRLILCTARGASWTNPGVRGKRERDRPGRKAGVVPGHRPKKGRSPAIKRPPMSHHSLPLGCAKKGPRRAPRPLWFG